MGWPVVLHKIKASFNHLLKQTTCRWDDRPPLTQDFSGPKMSYYWRGRGVAAYGGVHALYRFSSINFWAQTSGWMREALGDFDGVRHLH